MCDAPGGLLSSVLTPLRIFSRTFTDVHAQQLSPFKRALIVSKRSAYAYEHSRSSFTDEAAFEKSIIEKGKSYASLKSAHNFQNSILAELTRCLRAYDVEVRVVDFKHYDFSDAEWSDLIVSVGGDGTFLSAASKVLSRDKVIVGLNSRPASSEGSLCTANWWYQCIPEFIDRLMLGKFRRFWRQRIRLQLAPYVAPLETQHPELVNIHNISLNASSARTATRTGELETSGRSENRDSAPLTRTLPIRALNEVFVSTCMSARVSEYEISLDDSEFVRQKSSGLIVCTGTGSSAWYYNTNRVTPSLVHTLLALTEEELVARASNEHAGSQHLQQQQQQQSREGFTGYGISPLRGATATTHSLCGKSLVELADAVARNYNQKLYFSPEAPHMGYAVRDLVENNVFKFGHSFGFAYKIKLISRMADGYLSIDGGLAVPFNDGTPAELSINPEDAVCVLDMPVSETKT
ncbi:NAD kinase 2, mitochondrial [Sparganum proliferum]